MEKYIKGSKIAKLTVDEIKVIFSSKKKSKLVDGVWLHANTYLELAMKQGFCCNECKREIENFVVERQDKSSKPHLYAKYIDKNGKEKLFNIDHIFPKSLGGSNDVHNYQLLCQECNTKKANKIVLADNRQFILLTEYLCHTIFKQKPHDKKCTIKMDKKWIADSLDKEITSITNKPTKQNGRSEILQRCIEGNFDEVKRLVEGGADTTSATSDGSNMLHFACLSKNRKLINYLLDGFAFPHCNDKNRTHLHIALRAGMWDVAEKMIRNGYDPYLMSETDSTPRGCAAAHCRDGGKLFDEMMGILNLPTKKLPRAK